MSLFSSKKPRNRQIRRKVVHLLEDSDGEEKTSSSQEGEQKEGGSEQPSNGGPVATVTAPSSVKEKVGLGTSVLEQH